MASITPLLASQETAQTTASTTYVDATCEVSTALANGVDYMVGWRCQNGGNQGSLVCHAQLVFGSTAIAHMAEETSTIGGQPVAQQGGTAAAWVRITGDGSKKLKIQHKGSNGNTVSTQAMYIVAIPMDQWGTEDADYYHDANGATVTNAAVGSWTTLRSVSFSLPATSQSYLVFMSCEGTPGSGSAMASMCRFTADGTQIGSDYHREREDTTATQNYATASLISGLSGSTTFKIEVQSRATAESDYLRPNIWVIRADAWDQIKTVTDTTGASTSSESPVDFSGLDNSYTPNQTEYVIPIATVVPGSAGGSTGLCTLQLTNDTDGTDWNTGSGCQETDAGFDADRDQIVHQLFATEQISSAKTYKVQFDSHNDAKTVQVGVDPAGTTGIHSELVVWGLTTVAGDPDPGPSEFLDPVMLGGML